METMEYAENLIQYLDDCANVNLSTSDDLHTVLEKLQTVVTYQKANSITLTNKVDKQLLMLVSISQQRGCQVIVTI